MAAKQREQAFANAAFGHEWADKIGKFVQSWSSGPNRKDSARLVKHCGRLPAPRQSFQPLQGPRTARKLKAPAFRRALSNCLIWADFPPARVWTQAAEPPPPQPSPMSQLQKPRPVFVFFMWAPLCFNCDSAAGGMLTLIVMVSKQVTMLDAREHGRSNSNLH